jgi:hypothetical protein
MYLATLDCRDFKPALEQFAVDASACRILPRRDEFESWETLSACTHHIRLSVKMAVATPIATSTAGRGETDRAHQDERSIVRLTLIALIDLELLLAWT